MTDKRPLDGVCWVAAAIAVGGVIFLGAAVLEAQPFVFFGTEEERAAVERGRGQVVAAAVILAAGTALLVARGRTVPGALVALPTVLCTALVFVFPDSAFGLVAFALTAPVAAGAALAAALPVVPPRGRSAAAVVAVVVVLVALLASGLLAMLVLIAGATWWVVARYDE